MLTEQKFEPNPEPPKDVYKTAITSLKASNINSENIFSKVLADKGEFVYYTKLSLDKKLQKRIEKLLRRYKPPYAAFVGMDPDTGKILAMASYSRVNHTPTNWCLKSPFQAASVFKIVSSAAAIERLKMHDTSTINFNGRLYRLKKRNVFDKKRRFRNRMTLGDAFAKSVNIVFAKLVPRGMDPDDLQHYSQRFLFNHELPFELDVDKSKAQIPTEDYKLARTAAGFGEVTLSPLHGAMIVSAIVNGGDIVSPYILEKVYDENRSLVYKKLPDVSDLSLVEPETAHIMKRMMRRTLSRGTIRKTFRGWRRDRVLKKLYIGGKTGSLSSRTLRGEHDWFVGFAENSKKKLVVSAVIVNYPLWHIKPAYLAKEAFRNYFKK